MSAGLARAELTLGHPALKFLAMPHEAIPKLMLPNCSACSSRLIHSPCRKPFGILHGARNRQWGLGPNQCVPVVGHNHVTQKLKSQLRSGGFDAGDQVSVFSRPKGSQCAPEIHGHEENSIRIPQATYPGHAAMLRPRKPTAQKPCHGYPLRPEWARVGSETSGDSRRWWRGWPANRPISEPATATRRHAEADQASLSRRRSRRQCS